MNDSTRRQLREHVAVTSRQVATDGLVIGTAGNVSAREEDVVAITPTGADLASLTADDICLVDLEGTVIDSKFRPTSELELHTGVYRERTDVGALIHTHSLLASALSTVLTELPVLHYQQLLLGGELRVAAFHAFGTEALAESVRTALAGRQAALMANHGAVAVGPHLDAARNNAVLTEWLCDLAWHALALGQPRGLDAAQQAAVIKAAVSKNYGAVQPL